MTDTPGYSTSHGLVSRIIALPGPPGRATPRKPPQTSPRHPLPGCWGTSPHGAPGCRGPRASPTSCQALSQRASRRHGLGFRGLRSWQDGVKRAPGRGEEGTWSGRTFLCPPCELCPGAERAQAPGDPDMADGHGQLTLCCVGNCRSEQRLESWAPAHRPSAPAAHSVRAAWPTGPPTPGSHT